MGVLRGVAYSHMLNTAIGDQASNFGKALVFRVCPLYYMYGEFATSKPGAAVSGCLRRVRILKMASCCENMYQLLCPAASGGSES